MHLDALYDEHGPALLRFLLRLTHGNRPTAEDLFQETMLRAWRHRDALPPESDRVRRWLFTVGRRLVIDHVRQRQVRPVEVDLAEADDPGYGDDETSGAAMAVRSISDGFGALTEVHRQVLTEVYFRHRSVEAVAAGLRVPVGTVHSRVHYALRALRSSMN